MMRRMLAMMLVLLLLLGTAVAYGSSSDEAVFEQALALLKNNYTSAEQLNAAGEVLSGASSTHALSAYLKLYIDALLKLAENDLQGAKDRLLVLNAVDQSELNSMLAQNALPDCEQLDRYIKARELEDDKKLAAANEAYLSLLPLFDTTTRLVALQKSCRDYYDYGKMMAEDGELETAFAVFQNLGDFEDSPEQAAVLAKVLYARPILSADEVQPGDIVSYAEEYKLGDNISCAEEYMLGDTINYKDANYNTRYAKVGTINELDGYTSNGSHDNNNIIMDYVFSPTVDKDHVFRIVVEALNAPAEQSIDDVLEYYIKNPEELPSLSDKWELEIQGRPAFAFMERGGNFQEIVCRVAVNDEYTLCYRILLIHEDKSTFINQTQATELLKKYSSAFTITD